MRSHPNAKLSPGTKKAMRLAKIAPAYTQILANGDSGITKRALSVELAINTQVKRTKTQERARPNRNQENVIHSNTWPKREFPKLPAGR